jgi:hypothetical protein
MKRSKLVANPNSEIDRPGRPKRICCSLAPVTCLPGSSILSTQDLQKKISRSWNATRQYQIKKKQFFSVCFYIDISLDVGSTFENQLVSNTTAVASGTVKLTWCHVFFPQKPEMFKQFQSIRSCCKQICINCGRLSVFLPSLTGGVTTVVWTSLGPLPRWVPGPTTRWAPRTTRLALHGIRRRGAQGLHRSSTRLGNCTCSALYRGLLDVLD